MVDTKKTGKEIGKIKARKKELRKQIKALEMKEQEEEEKKEMEQKLKELNKSGFRKSLDTLKEKSKEFAGTAAKKLSKAGQNIRGTTKRASSSSGFGKYELFGKPKKKKKKTDVQPTGDPTSESFWVDGTFQKTDRPDSYWVG